MLPVVDAGRHFLPIFYFKMPVVVKRSQQLIPKQFYTATAGSNSDSLVIVKPSIDHNHDRLTHLEE